ncbi:MAG: 16S rRNA (cytosine(967)-C(5))-methyltransferase RsmB [Bacilli bacterium]|jgi:16S rRNA (cytosine967-C5)-methyltransferase|nr:16S rRNA (cytosine(967)-C(5))-methyltransferase RsmB [Bacilli bacterium]MDY0064068.1 16S rRNA (cytosine(967)-C(5))-methyltransferase RsmB [Bacilli bacterium]
MNVRKLAIEAILKIIIKGAYSNIAINEFINKFELSEEDKNLFVKLVLGTVDHKITLDYYLEPFLKKNPKPWVKILLIMSVFQIAYLDIPDYAVVNEAVDIAALKDRYTASFVNAVLRNFLRTPLRKLDNLSEVKQLSIQYSFPEWLVAYFLKDYSFEQVVKILKAFSKEPKQSIRINTLKANKEEVINSLRLQNITFQDTDLVTNGLLVEKPMMNHPLFLLGKITIQDLASQLVAEILQPEEDASILDLCSAPGGKAAHLAGLMNNKGSIFACEIHEHKLKLMKHNFDRLGVKNVHMQLVDARNVKEYVQEKSFDYVLADLPCSGLGVLGHKVDLKYHINLHSIQEIIQLQREIIENSYHLVKKNGFLVISTCTINKQENEEQVRLFLKNHPEFKIEVEKTILPYEYHTDGFYICKMRRV